MKKFHVYVLDKRYIRYEVEAENAEEAKDVLEEASNVGLAFPHMTLVDDCVWSVEKVEEVK